MQRAYGSAAYETFHGNLPFNCFMSTFYFAIAGFISESVLSAAKMFRDLAIL
jgi:hypothetical protein